MATGDGPRARSAGRPGSSAELGHLAFNSCGVWQAWRQAGSWRRSGRPEVPGVLARARCPSRRVWGDGAGWRQPHTGRQERQHLGGPSS